MSSENKGNEKGRFILYAKRHTEKEWSIWTNTDDLETLIKNVRTIEKCGNQWKVTETSEYTRLEQKRITDVEKATQEGYLKGYSEGCADGSKGPKQSEGEWKKPSRYSEPICTKCKKSPCQYFGMLPPFCPNCGAKMKGGEE